jgi:aspartyl-tRNA(Asn)/glutamyl-tRNA(Gln) amidotransferase subunit A
MLVMDAMQSPIAQLREAYARGDTTPTDVAREALARANGNASRNTYISLDADRVMAEAAGLAKQFHDREKWPLLYGVPVSLKDCFDMAGTVTTAGSKYYAERNPVSQRDSTIAERLRKLGAIIIGKTHMHTIAYGITGENPYYGDCVQPWNAARLTGGSSSGAAASVQEGSAMAAIGTDTGGSVRTPAALCGLVGYRGSHGMAERQFLWGGGVHLAKSFDTPGWLFRSAADGPVLGAALFDLEVPDAVSMKVRIGVVGEKFLRGCDADVRAMYVETQRRFVAAGVRLGEVDTAAWAGAMEIFAPIQAAEAAAVHRNPNAEEMGNFSQFPPEIAERLRMGEGIAPEKLQEMRFEHTRFRLRMDANFEQFDYLLVPCAPVAELAAGVDHTKTRPRVLRYLAPFSLGGNPVVALPGGVDGTSGAGGVQLAAARGADARLLRFAAQVEQN